MSAELTGEETPATDDKGARRVVGVIVLGTFLTALDVSLVNNGVPAIGRDLGGGGRLNWVFLSYLVAVAVAQPPSNWVAARLGRMRAFGASLAVFAAGAGIATVAPSLEWVSIGRTVQGLGAGAVFPIGLAVIHDAVPEGRRGGAFGWWGAATMVAPALAPVLSGVLIAVSHWRVLFGLDLALGTVAAVAAMRARVRAREPERVAFDGLGFVLAGSGLVMLLVGLDGWKSEPFVSGRVGGLVAGGVVALAILVAQQLRAPHPLLEIRIFRIRLFSLSVGLVWLMAAVQYARIFIIPVELQAVYGLSAFQAGLAIVPAGVATAVTMRLGGQLTDAVGPRLPVVLGVAISALGAWQLAVIHVDTPIAWVVGVLFVQGFGVGISMMPVTIVSMTSVPGPLVGQAAAVNSINRQIAGVLSVAVLAGVISSRAGSVVADRVTREVAIGAYGRAYQLVLVTLLASLLLAFALPGRWRREAGRADPGAGDPALAQEVDGVRPQHVEPIVGPA